MYAWPVSLFGAVLAIAMMWYLGPVFASINWAIWTFLLLYLVLFVSGEGRNWGDVFQVSHLPVIAGYELVSDYQWPCYRRCATVSCFAT